MANATDQKKFAHEQLRNEVNGALASAQGQEFLGMFSRQAPQTSYPYPTLDFHDTDLSAETPSGADQARSAGIKGLLSALEQTAASAIAPGER